MDAEETTMMSSRRCPPALRHARTGVTLKMTTAGTGSAQAATAGACTSSLPPSPQHNHSWTTHPSIISSNRHTQPAAARRQQQQQCRSAAAQLPGLSSSTTNRSWQQISATLFTSSSRFAWLGAPWWVPLKQQQRHARPLFLLSLTAACCVLCRQSIIQTSSCA